MAITNDLLSTTLRTIRPKFVDELYKKTAFLDAARKMGGIDFEDGGTKVDVPLSLIEHSNITEYPTGFEPTNVAVRTVSRNASFEWDDFSAPIVITKKEELENNSEKGVVKILEVRTKNVFGMLRRETNKQILAGNSTVLLNLGTLNGAASTTGFLEQLAVGTQTNIVGGVSKVTYNSTNGWQNQFADVANAAATALLPAMDLMWLNTRNVAPSGDVQVILASLACYGNYKRGLRANERYVDEKTLDGGRMSLAYAGAMVEADSDMPVNTAVGTDEWSQYWLNFDAVKMIIHSKADYACSDFIHSQGNTSRLAHVYHKCQLTTDHLGSLGGIRRADTW
tara:strand:- start:12296 stop:13309 length:1014 start_codon:yes stop_codon:yes gene_type:complete